MFVTMKAFIQPIGRPKDEMSIEAEYNPTVETLADPMFQLMADDAKDGILGCIYNQYRLDRIVYSVWESDTSIYNPANSRTISFVGATGSLLTGTEVLIDEDEAVFIRREVPSGRQGKMYLPGAVYMDLLTVVDGQWTLPAPAIATIQTRVDALYAALNAYTEMVMVGKSQTSIFYPETPEGVKQVPVRQYAAEPHVRLVTGFTVVGLRPRQRNV